MSDRILEVRWEATKRHYPGCERYLSSSDLRAKPHLVLHVVESTYSQGHTDLRFPLRWWVEMSSGAYTGKYKTSKSALGVARNRFNRFGSHA